MTADEIPLQELVELSGYYTAWREQVENDWCLLILKSLSPKAQAVLVSYLFEELTTVEGTSNVGFSWGKLSPEEAQGFKHVYKRMASLREELAGEQ